MAKNTHAPKGKKPKGKEPKAKEKRHGAAPRSMWSGSISFGLVQIPVSLYTAEVSHEISFKLLDKRDMTPVHYKRINRGNGKEVPWSDIVRGYERSPGELIVVTDEDLRRANVKASQTVDILDFVDAGSIDPTYFDKPYYLAPLQSKKRSLSNPRAYVLLREALRRTGKIGIAKVVLRTREHLAAVVPHEKTLILNLLRFDHELRKEAALDLAEDVLAAAKVAEKELDMAERLITEMASKWEPERYKDEYRDDVMALIERKAKAGEAHQITEAEEAPEPQAPGSDIIALLRQSLGGKAANRVTAEPHPKPRASKAAPRKKGGGQRKAA
jgi:DNA end-binding protein Ku